MSLRSELKEAMAEAQTAQRYPDDARVIRAEAWEKVRRCASGVNVARAVLAVIDEWEEVEVRESKDDSHVMRVARTCLYPDQYGPVSTILRRKQEPAPDVKELARRAVKAWRERDRAIFGFRPVTDAMDALAEAVDE